MKSQILIFDLDGTLIDSRGDLTAGINHMRERYGLEPLSVETVGGYIGNGVRKLVERSLQGSDIDLDEALQINNDYCDSHLVVHTTLYDGVEDGLRQLVEAGHQLALLTNKQGDPTREIMKHFGLIHLFSSIIGGGDVERLKPEPDGVFRCLKDSGMNASVAWMIGDNYTDLCVAENADVKSGFARYGFGDAREYEPTTYFASFPELVEYFVGS